MLSRLRRPPPVASGWQAWCNERVGHWRNTCVGDAIIWRRQPRWPRFRIAKWMSLHSMRSFLRTRLVRPRVEDHAAPHWHGRAK